MLGTHRGTGRSVRIVVTAERPALLLTASLGRPSTVFHVKSPPAKVDTTCEDLRRLVEEIRKCQMEMMQASCHIHNSVIHTPFSHRQPSHKQFFHRQLFHALSRTILSKMIDPPPSPFSFLLSPFRAASTTVSDYWKKLTCGAIRSFNCTLLVWVEPTIRDQENYFPCQIQ